MPCKDIIVGIPREIMPHEGRVPLLPDSVKRVRDALEDDCRVYIAVQKGVGASIGITSDMWKQAGAYVCDKRTLYRRADIILKVKQPFAEEVSLYHRGQLCACFHHPTTNQDVVTRLIHKHVLLAPFEYYRPGLRAMSCEAGRHVATILNTLCGESWKREHIFFGGGRGMVCQHAIAQCRRMGIRAKQIHACDRENGLFFSEKLRMSYMTFSGEDQTELCEHLQKCRILVLAAVGPHGAPRFLTHKHLDLLPDGAVIVQVSIDEGGNIDDPEFQRVTYWGNPSYTVQRGSKQFTVCNIPDIPGCLSPESASRALDEINFPYYLELFKSFPSVADEFLYFSGA